MKRVNLHELFPPHTYDGWREVVQAWLKGAPFEKKLVKSTYEGIDILPMYFKKDMEDLSFSNAFPGDPPFARGASPLGNVLAGWGIYQDMARMDPVEFNRAAKKELEKGQTFFHIALDKAMEAGTIPESGKSGKWGLFLAFKNDAVQAFSGINLTQACFRISTGPSSLPIAALILAALGDMNASSSDLRGQITSDPAAYLASTGALPDLKTVLDHMALFTSWACENTPDLKTIGVSGIPYHEAGGSAVQELAFALAAGAAYLREMNIRGIDAEKAAAKTGFSFSIGTDFFMEIAKFRAARLLWDQVTRAFGVPEESRVMNILARTGRFNKTLTDPYVNMLRVTTEAFSAVCGGCDAIYVGPFDEVFRQPSEFSRRVARNVSVLLREECHFDKVIDPAGGSYYVENITDQLARKAWGLFQEVEKAGGIFKALETGFCAGKIGPVASARAKNYAKRKDVLVGTNKYPNSLENISVEEVGNIKQTVESRSNAIEQFKKDRDESAVQAGLAAVSKGRESEKLDLLIHAANAGATLEELAGAIGLNPKAGSSMKVEPLSIHRAGERFEAMRIATADFAQKTGEAPKIFSANLGPLAVHKPRADFSFGFFTVAGFEMISSKGFSTAEEAAEAVCASGAKVAVICSSDALYKEMAEDTARAIKEKDLEITVILAGYPKDQVEALKSAGVDDFIYLGSDAASLLENLQKKLGVAK